MLEKREMKYDYILRMNSTTWCNFEALERLVGYFDNEKVNYAGALYSAWWTFHRIYFSGTSMLLNWNDALVTTNDRWVPRGINEKGIIDDVAISASIFSRYIQIGVDYAEHFKSLGIEYELMKDRVNLDIDWKDRFMHTLFISVKNVYDEDGYPLPSKDISTNGYSVIADNRDNEYQKMREIQRIYNSMHFTDDDIEEIRKNIIADEDDHVYMLKCTKDEHLNKEVDVNAWQYDSENLVDKAWVVEHQEELEREDKEHNKSNLIMRA